MYAISNDYKTYINNSLSRQSKSKVVIDGVEYLDNVLMSTPSISHSNETMIGGFPSKTCSFEIKDETLNLNDKWITVYRGLVINGATEWIPMGIFKTINDGDITTNKTTKTIKFKGYDKRQLLDTPYTSSLDWTTSHTGLEIVQEICTNTGLELESTTFNFASYVFTQKPNFPSNITNTEVISRIAELGGEIALITRLGKIHIKSPYTTNVTITKGKRRSLTKENKFGTITTLVLGNEGYDDDIVYKAKNLFNKNSGVVYSNGTTITPIENGLRATSTLSGSYLSSGILVPIDKVLNKTVTLSATITPSASNNGIAILYWLNSNYEPTTNIIPINSTSNSYTYQIDSVPDSAEYLGVLFYSNYTSETINVGDYVDYTNIQLEIGEVATSYEDFISYEETEWRIENNPYVELIRENIIETIAPFILGRSIIPFEMSEVIDDFYLDLNDTITITDSDGTTFNSTILSYDTTSRIKSTIKAPAQKTTLSNYDIAGGIRKTVNKVKLEVNHNTNQIKGLVSKTDDLIQKTSEVIQSAEAFTTDFYNDVIKEQIDELTGQITQEVETRQAGMRVSTDEDNNIVIELGSSTSPFTLELKNDGLYIYQNGELLQFFANSYSNTPNIEVTNTLKLGNFAFKPRENGNVSLVKVGDD
jgi:hypothetical protein